MLQLSNSFHEKKKEVQQVIDDIRVSWIEV